MTISIIHNLGLGDHIICAPIVAKIASETKGKVLLPCWKHNRESVASFFVNHPNVLVMAIEKESELRDFEPSIRLGHYGAPRQDNEDFITWFYRQANFPLEDREKWCPLKEATERVPSLPVNEMIPFHFLHDKPEHAIDLNKILTLAYPITPNTAKNSILTWREVLQKASEIHCIDSSFLHLADALPTTGKLFFHRYARAGLHNKNLALRKAWEILE